jgi:hypothetical protein
MAKTAGQPHVPWRLTSAFDALGLPAGGEFLICGDAGRSRVREPTGVLQLLRAAGAQSPHLLLNDLPKIGGHVDTARSAINAPV